MQTTFLIQATYMKLKISESFTVPAAALSIFDIVAVLALIPFMDYVVYPLLSYYGIRFTPLRRIGVGMLFAAASVIVAGVVEIKRRNDGGFHMQTVFDEKYNASSTSILWQVPQFVLIGSSEVLASITGTLKCYSIKGALSRTFFGFFSKTAPKLQLSSFNHAGNSPKT